jgi:hypothetical protein
MGQDRESVFSEILNADPARGEKEKDRYCLESLQLIGIPRCRSGFQKKLMAR